MPLRQAQGIFHSCKQVKVSISQSKVQCLIYIVSVSFSMLLLEKKSYFAALNASEKTNKFLPVNF